MERPLRSGVICRVGSCAGEQAASCGRGVKDVDVTQRIQEQLKSNPVVLYMKGTPDFPQCGSCCAGRWWSNSNSWDTSSGWARH